MKLFTIGYEGLEPAELFQNLKDNGVEVLVDVRELPISRKRGFAKSALAAEAARWGIEYRHVRALGCPRAIRFAYRANPDRDVYTRDLLAYLETQEEVIRETAGLCAQRSCCLMCVEADPTQCHRSFVAEEILKIDPSNLDISHLTGKVI